MFSGRCSRMALSLLTVMALGGTLLAEDSSPRLEAAIATGKPSAVLEVWNRPRCPGIDRRGEVNERRNAMTHFMTRAARGTRSE